jgi:hypothetical protein
MLHFAAAKGPFKRLHRCFSVALILFALALHGKPALASPLNLTLQAAPDMFSDAIEVSYDSASQSFTASGFAEHINNGTGTPTPIVNGVFKITANISNSGTFQSGTLTVTGEVPSLGIGPGQLLVGNLSALGYGEAGGAVECQFSTSGGTLSFQFGPVINVILGQSGFRGDFAQNFNNGATGVAGIGW